MMHRLRDLDDPSTKEKFKVSRKKNGDKPVNRAADLFVSSSFY